jgi:hypothetical protein
VDGLGVGEAGDGEDAVGVQVGVKGKGTAYVEFFVCKGNLGDWVFFFFGKGTCLEYLSASE